MWAKAKHPCDEIIRKLGCWTQHSYDVTRTDKNEHQYDPTGFRRRQIDKRPYLTETAPTVTPKIYACFRHPSNERRVSVEAVQPSPSTPRLSRREARDSRRAVFSSPSFLFAFSVSRRFFMTRAVPCWGISEPDTDLDLATATPVYLELPGHSWSRGERGRRGY